ncbi:antitoxin Xre/MbcA/ParS toxin-binding domain-containing protein [Pseudomonas fluorescens]|uniref:antitoxin Xre/MbcA/ParS toxin-binding domain-containing protein n=1 Tax=Pseudomonas fluorescens TaxID=294 RepID=UPI003F9DBC9D
MITSRIDESASITPAPTATECLIKEIGQLSESGVVLLIIRGFEIDDVHAMISLSKLYSTPQITGRIMGKTGRAMRKQRDIGHPTRLNAHQSAIAFHYAKTLEQATAVFGTQIIAEEWLSRPCKYLSGLIPLDLIENAIGYQAVGSYLDRVELGIYQ